MSRYPSVPVFVRAALSLTVLTASAAALAQSPPAATSEEALENVVVTGTRIVRDGFQSPTPVSVLGAERLEERAASNIGDALNELPAFRGTQTPAAQGFNGGYVGGRVLDLRGLGTQRTLTLVDGKRFVPSTTQATVDTNMIPAGLIERVDVVTGGASAAYGSDAVAGVVNFIVNDKLTGLKASAEYGSSSRSDDKTTAFHLAGGTSLFGGRGHALFAADFEKNDGIGDCQTRSWCANGEINYGRTAADVGFAANNMLTNVHPATINAGGVINGGLRGATVVSTFNGIAFNPDGTPRPFIYGAHKNSLFMVGGEGAGSNPYFDGVPIMAATNRTAVYTRTKYDFTDDVVGRFDLSYGHLEGTHYATRYRSNLSAAAQVIQSTNAFLPRSSNPALDIPTLLAANNLTGFQLGRVYDDYGNPQILSNDGALRAVFSLNGKLAGSWTWDAYYQLGRNQYNSTTSNNVINSRIAKAIDSVRDASGNPVCRVNLVTVTDPACVPLNPFGNQVSPAAWNYVTGSSVQTNKTIENVVAGNLQGEVFSTWAGPASVATGAEYRSDTIEGNADALSQSLAFFANNASKISGKIVVKEAYLETIVPLAKDLFLARDLQLNGAVRRTMYDRSNGTTGSEVKATTWKLGGSWTPIDSLRFRATKSRDIRAPNIAELFGPTTSAFAILNDPQRGGAQTNPATLSGANPNLVPESADTRTIGLVLQPQMDGPLGRAQLSVDYYDITINKAIGSLGAQTIVTRCFQGATEFCGLITRDPNTQAVTLVQDVLLNVNQLITRGVDIEVDYKQPMGDLGGLDLRFLATIVSSLKTIDSGGAVDRAGQTGLRGGTIPGIPDYTLDAMLTWKRGPAQLSLHGRYIPAGIYNALFIGPDQPGFSLALGNSTNNNDVPAATYLDLSGQYAISSVGTGDLVVFGAVNNITDKDPPSTPGANGSGNNVLFDVIGRNYKVGLRYKF